MALWALEVRGAECVTSTRWCFLAGRVRFAAAAGAAAGRACGCRVSHGTFSACDAACEPSANVTSVILSPLFTQRTAPFRRSGRENERRRRKRTHHARRPHHRPIIWWLPGDL